MAITEGRRAKSAVMAVASSKGWKEKRSFPASPSIRSLLHKDNVKAFNSMTTNSLSEGSCSAACTERTVFTKRAATGYSVQHAASCSLPAARRQGGGGRYCCFAEEELRHAEMTARAATRLVGPAGEHLSCQSAWGHPWSSLRTLLHPLG